MQTGDKNHLRKMCVIYLPYGTDSEEEDDVSDGKLSQGHIQAGIANKKANTRSRKDRE